MNFKDFANDVKKQQKELLSDIIKKVQTNISNMKTDEVIVGLAKDGIKILIPQGYKRAKANNPYIDALKKGAGCDEANKGIGYFKEGAGYIAAVLFYEPDINAVMDFKDVKGLIDGIHKNMSDSEGIIEVKAGKTKSDYDYIYSIVKTVKGDVGGVLYYVRLNLKHDKEVVEARAIFDEIGMTGGREAMVYALAKDIIEVTDDGLKGWSEDPYDKDYTKGIPMNLAEKEGIDGLFPNSPLTQAREFMLAVLEDKYVLTEEEVEKCKAENKQSEADEGDDNTNESNADIIKRLLTDDCRRFIKDIDVKR